MKVTALNSPIARVFPSPSSRLASALATEPEHIGKMDTIRINLVDYTNSLKHVDFLAIPVTNDKDFACVPDGLLSLRVVIGLTGLLS